MTNFRRYDLQKQYEIYIYGNQIREPPAVYLAEAFAMEGRAVVGMLQEKLLTASDDLTVTNIVVVFGWISFLKSYDVAANKNLVDILADKIGHVRDPYLKQTCKREMAKIVGGSASQQESGNH
jgi:hypothetical protein